MYGCKGHGQSRKMLQQPACKVLAIAQPVLGCMIVCICRLRQTVAFAPASAFAPKLAFEQSPQLEQTGNILYQHLHIAGSTGYLCTTDTQIAFLAYCTGTYLKKSIKCKADLATARVF